MLKYIRSENKKDIFDEIQPDKSTKLTHKYIINGHTVVTDNVLIDDEIDEIAEKIEGEKLLKCDENTKKTYYLKDIEEIYRTKNNTENISFNILFLGYPLYLLMRFIIWAIKTLRKKENV